jgi:YaiO family outer membrane protein
VKYYRYQEPTFNFFFQGGMVKREGKNDYIGLFGFAKDWNPNLYTYTVVAKGTVSTYLPNARFDHDFNFKVGKKRNVLLTLGVTYIKYYVPAEDFIISSGLTWYLGHWVSAYRLFWNHKKPGNIRSFSHLASLEYSIDKAHSTALSVSWGSQAYLALYVLLPEQIRQSAFNINLLHRQWITRGIGCFGQVGYLDLKDTYRKYLLTGGIFFEF